MNFTALVDLSKLLLLLLLLLFTMADRWDFIPPKDKLFSFFLLLIILFLSFITCNLNIFYANS